MLKRFYWCCSSWRVSAWPSRVTGCEDNNGGSDEVTPILDNDQGGNDEADNDQSDDNQEDNNQADTPEPK